MTVCRKWINFIATMLCVVTAQSCPATAQVSEHKPVERSRMALSQILPQLDGSHLTVKVLRVTFGPGESSTSHTHPCPVIGYVVEGALRMQVQGEPETIYKAGESFYEAPNGIHLFSANASAQEPVSFIAYFVCDHETPLTIAVPTARPTGGK